MAMIIPMIAYSSFDTKAVTTTPSAADLGTGGEFAFAKTAGLPDMSLGSRFRAG